jgi:GT2 family glycosyltransferase
VNYCTRDLLEDCLNSIAQGGVPETDVVVVDNHSSDGSVAMVESKFPGVRVIANKENVGFAKANNQGMKEARGEYILLLNSDTIVLPGAFRAMSEFLSEHPEAGGAACRLLNADGSIQASIGRQAGPGITRLVFRLSGLSRLIRRGHTRHFLRRYFGWILGETVRSYLGPYTTSRAAMEVESISGACLMLRREAIDAIGVLDENFFMYLEDLDYCARLRKAGWKLYYIPAGEIIHLVGRSSGGRMRQYSIHSYQSLFYFYQKHYSAWTVLTARALVLIAMCIFWIWNLIRGVFSSSQVYAQNRFDLAKVIGVCIQPGTYNHAHVKR